MMDKGSAGVAVLLLTILLPVARATQTNFELNIAVLPEWKDVINPIMASKHLGTMPVNLHTFDVGKTRSEFDKVKKAVENLQDHNTHVVIGPFDVAISLATEALNITYLATTQVTSTQMNSTFQISPKLDDFSQALLDMVKRYNWMDVSVFFDANKAKGIAQGYLLVQNCVQIGDVKDVNINFVSYYTVLELSTRKHSQFTIALTSSGNCIGISLVEKLLTNHELMIKSWRLDRETNDRQVRDHLVHMRRIFMKRSIVFCRKRNVEVLLETARSLAMLSTPYEWFFYDPGDELVDVINNFPDIHVNFTVFTMMPFNSTQPSGQFVRDTFNTTLAQDAVALLQKVLNEPFEKNTTSFIRNALVERIFSINFKGKSGTIQFDEHGERANLSIILTEISGYSTHQIGEWYSEIDLFAPRLQIGNRRSSENVTHPFPLVGRTARVVTILEKPFCMYKRDHKVRHGNDRFEGFAIDLIQEVATMLHFDYEVYLVHDGNFGTKRPDGSWNGMIGELLEGNATMSVAPLSINSEREAAVDFTKPFMTRYISVLMKVPRSETSYFEFLNPLHPTVWFCTLGAFVFVSIVLYILERIGAIDQKECPSISFKESFWFVFGSLLQGSTDSSPSTLPGRILTSSWWFFALILISSYTANLAAFLTVKKINTPIKTVTDLASQTKIKYGTVQSSGIMSFFQNTDIEHFSKMWAQMSEIEPSSMVASTEEGFKKVKEELYAFFWDTTVNKYKTIENCDFMEIGPPFDPKGFGIGVPPGATYREELSMAILRLSDIGRLHELENRWWGSRNCPDHGKPSTDETSELQIDNVAGVFFILVGGVAVAAVVCLGEYFAKQISNSVKKEKHARVTDKERESFL